VAACLAKSTIKKGRGTVPVAELIEKLSPGSFLSVKPELLSTYEKENLEINERIIDDWVV